MNININNYEAFFLDYFEGTLGKKDIAELFDFIEAHPHIKEEFDNFEEIPLTPIKVIFDRKEVLKKSLSSSGAINESNCEHYFIANLEGDLSKDEKKDLQLFIKHNPAYLSIFELLQKTKLRFDESIVFPGKSFLKKSVIRPIYYYVSAAASILLIFFIYFYSPSHTAIKKEMLGKSETRKNILQSKVKQFKIKEEPNVLAVEKQDRKRYEANKNATDIIIVENKAEPLEVAIAPKDHIESPPNMVADNFKEEKIQIQKNEVKIDEFAELSETKNHNQEKIKKEELLSKTENEFLNIKELAAKKFKKAINPEENGEASNEKNAKLSFWDLADAGIKGISKLTGKSWKVNKKYNETGDVSAFAVISDKFEFSKTIVKAK